MDTTYTITKFREVSDGEMVPEITEIHPFRGVGKPDLVQDYTLKKQLKAKVPIDKVPNICIDETNNPINFDEI